MAYDIMKDKNPLSINIQKLQRYNFNFFKLEEVVFFEYLVVKSKSFKFKPFFHSSETIFKETGIKRNKLDAILKRFIELEILSIEIKGFPKVKHFVVNFEKVQYYLPKIYQSAENGRLHPYITKLLDDFYNPYVISYKQKNNKSILKENLKEKIESDPGWDTLFNKFNEKVKEIQSSWFLTASSVKFDDNRLYQTYKTYGEELITYIDQYFQIYASRGKISDFLKPDKIDSSKNTFIEKLKIQEKADARKIIEKLTDTYNSRREQSSTSKKKYSKTSLIINNVIIEKAAQVLKVIGENEINDAFIAYSDAMLKGEITPNKILPYFFTEKYGSYPVIEEYLDHFNVNYSIRS
jgi:hypothetical protein